ncbi:hypothetical protein L226DRAFT_309565 [Lentinus tigrinus ALCF2SS1-7]|uniref:Uncharacterized protein n=1 Tax=Lentinus tigrinus ALCF2SS1-6 TaxID=1328759 RepID=A0A5C2S920_9APHY|nr:hypothetical protein L227DRAFT_198895 [Lentinus tigrinus ALCF2SS1-6]RPD69039.1 hypothetical protein L226DRAFT_309565 [Lentinus tigrinus ALCF2SS1-7]
MMDFQSLWSILLGVLSIVLALLGTWSFVNTQLPSKNLHTMFDMLDDTDGLLLSCKEEGLVPVDAADDFRTKLAWHRASAEETRLRTLAAKNYIEDFTNWLRGLTRKMRKICQDVREIRSEISTTSMRERQRLAAERDQREAGGEGAHPSAADNSHTLPAPVQPIDPANMGEQAVQQVATPLNEAASASPDDFPAPDAVVPVALPVSIAVSTCVPPATPSITDISSTIKQARKLRHSDRRCSVSSNSSDSVASSLHSTRCEHNGDPLSRSRAIATFLRYIRVRHPPGMPVYLIDPQQLAVCELAEDDSDGGDDDEDDSDGGDGDLVHELAVRVVA